ncbi:Gp37-like protein [Rhodococcus qingshengii]|uniref:Gp37-like protein n=1 Tax=Rhodococcus qingshengii TaxID=334542 RepID=UPI001ABFA3BD|nr:hypothetical protein [Rhodococcus qingshengii]
MTTLAPDLTTTDPWEAFILADQLLEEEKNALALPLFNVTMFNPIYGAIGEANDYVSATVTFKRNAVGTGTLVFKGSDDLANYAAQNCKDTVVGITVEANGTRWSGRVDTADDDTVDGVNTITLQLVSDWNWFNKIMVWPTWWAPIQFQPIKEAIYIGPAKTVILTMIAEQLIRLQTGMWELVNNITDPTAWFGTMLQKEGLLTPCAIVPPDWLHDTSKWVAITGRMDSVAALTQQILKDEGLVLSAELWLPGDPQPAPNHYTLTEPTIVMDVKDYSTVAGLTGTFLDGLIHDVVDIADTAIGEIVGAINHADSGSNLTLSSLLGFDSKPSWVLFEDGPKSGIRESHLSAHHPLAYTVIGGGKSPQWVNKLIDLSVEYLLSAILTAIGGSGIASTLLDGMFDDIVLAFQLVENYPRRAKLGRFGYPEFFASTGSAAYTVDELMALESAMWDSRGYLAYSLVVQDGYPYSYGRDYVIGSAVSWVYKGKLYTDYCTEATLVDDRTNRITCTPKIGDGSAQESPFAKLARKEQQFANAFKAASMRSN